MSPRTSLTLLASCLLASCAGCDPQPIASVQATDQMATCTMIRAEIEANNTKVRELADEKGWKTTQNVAAGVAGLFIPVLWFGMDFKGAADKDMAALDARQHYLTELAAERCRSIARQVSAMTERTEGDRWFHIAQDRKREHVAARAQGQDQGAHRRRARTGRPLSVSRHQDGANRVDVRRSGELEPNDLSEGLSRCTD